MALYGDIDITRSELLSCEFNDEYNIITGYRSSQFLGRKARSATLRINYRGNTAQLKTEKWKNAADLGNSRGLILVGNTLEGIFGISKITTVIRQEVRGVITQIILEIQLIEDASQKVR